jgi:hypothetical protein
MIESAGQVEDGLQNLGCTDGHQVSDEVLESPADRPMEFKSRWGKLSLGADRSFALPLIHDR